MRKKPGRKHVRDDDIDDAFADAQRSGIRAEQPIGDDGHRNGYLLRDAHSSAATPAEEAAGNALGAESRRQSNHERRHLWSDQWYRWGYGHFEDRRHWFVTGKNPHRAFGNYAGGGIG